ncbi:prepilin-type N-terminal cleavage/methylation domain-containing protein [Opitutaceae bacterium TAV1]|nr:prepilin-type N-terminal cleavage/methylation domain-containing protein [Opitutaceae bacterium TAV1]
MITPLHSIRCRSRAFTLIELLTVIAIIGILAAIIIPTVGRVRQSARAARSTSNLKQIAQAALSYVNDNKQHFPYRSNNSGSGAIWSDALNLHMGWPLSTEDSASGPHQGYNKKFFTQTEIFLDPLLSEGWHHRFGDYGCNSLVLVTAAGGSEDVNKENNIEKLTGPRPSITDIEAPSRRIIVMASEVGTFAGSGGRPPFPGSWRVNAKAIIANGFSAIETVPTIKEQRPAERMPGKYLSAFADGHVQWLTREDFDSREKLELLFGTL